MKFSEVANNYIDFHLKKAPDNQPESNKSIFSRWKNPTLKLNSNLKRKSRKMTTLAKFPKATTITIYSLGIFLGLLHIFFGVIALTPLISQDYHKEQVINYTAFAKFLFFLHGILPIAKLAFYLRYVVSVSQVFFGVALLENGYFGPAGKIGNYGLLILDLIYLFFQISITSSYERIAPTIVFTILLLTRLIFVEQSQKGVKVGVKTRNAGKVKTSTPKKNRND